jgi:proline/glutamate/leucine-rich protein 1
MSGAAPADEHRIALMLEWARCSRNMPMLPPNPRNFIRKPNASPTVQPLTFSEEEEEWEEEEWEEEEDFEEEEWEEEEEEWEEEEEEF